MTSPPAVLNLLPDTAPFTPEQRLWLSGMLAGLLGLDQPVTPLPARDAAALLAGLPPAPGDAASEAPVTDAVTDPITWHDPAIPINERMKLAEGRSLHMRLMAAMAQQDCGQCGSSCEDYSGGIATGAEARLNLCVPGGRDTSRMLKKLMDEAARSPPVPSAVPAAVPPLPRGGEGGPSRDNPATATLVSRTRLNRPGSAKETWHIEFDIAASGLDYAVGDSFGVLPTNDPNLVEAVFTAIGAAPDFPIGDRTLRQALTHDTSLGAAPDALFQLYSYITGGARRRKAQALSAGEDPDGDARDLDVLAAIEKFAGARPDPEAFVEALDPLQPRLYSISSSPRAHPGRLSVTVDAVRYRIGRRQRLGVASTFLADRMTPGGTVKAYVQKARNFSLPADARVPIVMIGPGTGIAPFRAFLYERMATNAPGRNWLFFGHQHRDFDFLYEAGLKGMRASGLLTRLSLAWSRDDAEKFYVQDRMRQSGADVWAWLADGAHVYVCGAVRMGQDVERAMVDIAIAHGGRTADQAVAFLADLKRRGRYQTDVY